MNENWQVNKKDTTHSLTHTHTHRANLQKTYIYTQNTQIHKNIRVYSDAVVDICFFQEINEDWLDDDRHLKHPVVCLSMGPTNTATTFAPERATTATDFPANSVPPATTAPATATISRSRCTRSNRRKKRVPRAPGIRSAPATASATAASRDSKDATQNAPATRPATAAGIVARASAAQIDTFVMSDEALDRSPDMNSRPGSGDSKRDSSPRSGPRAAQAAPNALTAENKVRQLFLNVRYV
jgi:hypothetical protein